MERPHQLLESEDQGDSPSRSGNSDLPDYGQVLREIADQKFLLSTRHQEQHWRAQRFGAHPDILKFEKALVKRLNKLGVPMFSNEVLRSPERQTEIYIKGNSRAKAGQSPHQYGCAVDIIHGVKGWEISNDAWKLIGFLGEEEAKKLGLKIKWGGSFPTLWDPAHWELTFWKQVKEDFPWA